MNKKNKPDTGTGKQLSPRKPLTVPELTEAELQAMASADAEIRASGLVTMFDRVLPAIPSQYQFSLRDRRFVENAFNATFDLIGGVPRLAIWADQNPGEFFKLYAKMMPEAEKANQALNAQINITNHIPRSALDDVTLSAAHIIDSGEDDDL
jgi:hypothetical protein